MENFLKYLDLIICLTGILVYIVMLILFSIKLHHTKKLIMEKTGVEKIKASPKFIICLILSIIIIIVPILIRVSTWIIVILTACALMGESLVFKDRIDELCNISQ